MKTPRYFTKPLQASTPTGRLFGVFAAVLLAFTAIASARPFTPSERAINAHLPPGTTVFTATQDQILSATQSAIAQPAFPRGVNPATLVATGDAYAAKYAPALATAGLDRVQSDTTLFTAVQRRVQTSYITNVSMRAAMVGSRVTHYTGATNKADGAAAVTAAAVNAVKNSAHTELLAIVVRSAVASAQRFGTPTLSYNGAAGAVTGAISQVAGISNGNINDSTDTGDNSDNLVKTVISTAVAAAPRRLYIIAAAVGYSFAGTYRATTNPGLQDDANTFTNTNLQALITAVLNGLPARVRTVAVRQTISDQITAGIALAYNGYSTGGSAGVSQFAYNNGQDPVTDTTGL